MTSTVSIELSPSLILYPRLVLLSRVKGKINPGVELAVAAFCSATVCSFSVKWCQPFYMQESACPAGPVLPALPEGVGVQSQSHSWEGEVPLSCSAQRKPVLAVTRKWVQSYGALFALSESNQVKLSMRRNETHGWGGVQMKTRSRWRLTWESPRVFLKSNEKKKKRKKEYTFSPHFQIICPFKTLLSYWLISPSLCIFACLRLCRACWQCHVWQKRMFWALGGERHREGRGDSRGSRSVPGSPGTCM